MNEPRELLERTRCRVLSLRDPAGAPHTAGQLEKRFSMSRRGMAETAAFTCGTFCTFN
jgi:hypothetical protein